MRWIKKLLLPSLVVLFSLLVSVFGFEKQVSATARNINAFSLSGLNFTTLASPGSNNFKYRLFDVDTFNNLAVSRFTNPSFTFNNNLRSNKENGILLDFFVFIKNSYKSSEDLLAAPYCPDDNTNMYQGMYAVAECQVELVGRERVVDEWNVEYFSASAAINEIMSDASNDVTHIFRYRIIAYQTGDNFVNTSGFGLYGPLFTLAASKTGVIRSSVIYVLFNYAIDGQPINRKSADEQMNDKDEEDRQNLENQTSETESDANEQGAAAQSTGTSLLGVFSAFVSSLAQIHETNCLLPSISVYGLDLGRMDLCTFDVPPGIIALATVGMIFIIVPLSFHLARRLINIFRSFQG